MRKQSGHEQLQEEQFHLCTGDSKRHISIILLLAVWKQLLKTEDHWSLCEARGQTCNAVNGEELSECKKLKDFKGGKNYLKWNKNLNLLLPAGKLQTVTLYPSPLFLLGEKGKNSFLLLQVDMNI